MTKEQSPSVSPRFPRSPIAKHRLSKSNPCVSAAPATRESSPADVEDLNERFIGEVELPERTFAAPMPGDKAAHGHVDMEPLLMETNRRFVLFPIQYNEASTPYSYMSKLFFTRLADLGHVQESASIILDSRRD